MNLSIKKLYNARNDGGIVKRGESITDWKRYGLFYGKPENLTVHNFDNWFMMVFDESALGTFERSDYAGIDDLLIYLPFGSEFRKAAIKDGYVVPNPNPTEVAVFISNFKSKINDIIDIYLCQGVFFDMCDTGYYDPLYGVIASDHMKDALLELCDYIRGKGGKSIINGTPYFADVGEYFMLESFIGSWGGNAFQPNWNYLETYHKYPTPMSETGVYGGIAWTHGITPYLYVWKYAYTGANKTLQLGHAYGNPKSVHQYGRQVVCYAGFRAMGINSVNYIDPPNQVLTHLKLHDKYSGFPLETPQFDFANKKVRRRFSGGEVIYDDENPENSITGITEPDYWETDKKFTDINWAGEGNVDALATWSEYGYIPSYIHISSLTIWDDRDNINLKITFDAELDTASFLPVYIYFQLDSAADGFAQFRGNKYPYLEFRNSDDSFFKTQFYIYGKSIFQWTGSSVSDNSWKYLYPVEIKKEVATYYYKIKKETLSYITPTWNGNSIDVLMGFLGVSGAGAFVNGSVTNEIIDIYGPNPEGAGFYPDIIIDSYNLTTILGHANLSVTKKLNYIPHNAVIYEGVSSSGNKINTVTITGSNWQKAWVFDKETAKFIGPDNTPDTYYSTSPFTPNKDIDATDIYIGVSYDSTSRTNDDLTISGVNVALSAWAGSHDAAYDVGLPELINYTGVYDAWKDEYQPTGNTYTYTPLGLQRSTIKLKKDNVTEGYSINIQTSASIVELLKTTDIRGSKVTLRRTFEHSDHTSPTGVSILIIAYIYQWELNDDILILNLKTNFQNWQSKFPQRRLSYFCPYVFKDVRCQYEGVETICQKTLTHCKTFENEINFGGITTIPRLQRGKWG